MFRHLPLCLVRRLFALLALLFAAVPGSAQTVRVTAQCDFYERPSVSSTRLGGLFPGNTATRLGATGRWLHLRRNGQTGYAMASCAAAAAGGSAPRTSSRSASAPRSSESREYRVGPRGGCYYVNAQGRRVNTSRSNCGLSARSAAPSRSTPRTRSTSRTRRSYTSGRSGYITGPRGGCYYINSNGNKTYVDHSYCGR